MDISVRFGSKVVYLGSTAFFRGEGPNVEGFRLATWKEEKGAVTPEEAHKRIVDSGRDPRAVEQFLLQAKVWSE